MVVVVVVVVVSFMISNADSIICKARSVVEIAFAVASLASVVVLAAVAIPIRGGNTVFNKR